MLATFWNTVTWTLSCEVMLYLAFPFLIRLRWPRGTGKLIAMFLAFWIIGLIPHSIYVLHDPDHFGRMATRYDSAFWINTLKYTPLPYICTFLAGITLGHLHKALKFNDRGRTIIGIIGFTGAWFAAYHLEHRLPYIMIHGGLLSPIFACIILGLSGPGLLARIFSTPPLVTIGASTYCLYLLHFNLFILIHDHHLPQLLHVARFDPWISYVAIILFCIGIRKFVEHPCQIAIGNWWKRKRAAQQSQHPLAKIR
jgi:peptidoglycan/LPS O-acetylase OafA/YrhL